MTVKDIPPIHCNLSIEFFKSMCDPRLVTTPAPVLTTSGSRLDKPGLGAAYWRLWTSAGLSSLADGIVKIALPLVAIRFTRSPVLIAGLTFAVTLPWLLFALQAGALADRLDRRLAMLGANCARALLLVVIVVAIGLGAGSIWALYAVALSVGVAETIYDTSAQSIMPQVVRRDQLPRANGRLYAAELAANQFIGPPLAGFLTAAGAVVAFAAPAALWAVAIAALLLVRGRFKVERAVRSTVRADIAEGLRFLWSNKLLRVLAVMVGVFNTATSATSAVLVLFAVGPRSAMGLSAQVFGLLLAGTAAGSVLGSFGAELVIRLIGRARALLVSLLCGALFVGAPAVSTNAAVIGVAFFVGGIGIIFWNVVTVSLRQRITPDRLLGRVNSCYRLVAWCTLPLGAAAGGLIGQQFGLRAVFALMAVLTGALCLGMLIVTDARMDAAEREADLAAPRGGGS
jgi:MFS family permease